MFYRIKLQILYERNFYYSISIARIYNNIIMYLKRGIEKFSLHDTRIIIVIDESHY